MTVTMDGSSSTSKSDKLSSDEDSEFSLPVPRDVPQLR